MPFGRTADYFSCSKAFAVLLKHQGAGTQILFLQVTRLPRVRMTAGTMQPGGPRRLQKRRPPQPDSPEAFSNGSDFIIGSDVEMVDTLGIEPRASRMLSGCDTTTPCALDGYEPMRLQNLGSLQPTSMLQPCRHARSTRTTALLQPHCVSSLRGTGRKSAHRAGRAQAPLQVLDTKSCSGSKQKRLRHALLAAALLENPTAFV